MSRKNYVYDNGKTHKERVNVYQLEKRESVGSTEPSN